MRTKLLASMLSVAAFAIILSPAVALGQADPQAGGSGNFIPCSGTTCSACHFVALANKIIAWLIGILAIIFVIMMVSSGMRLVISGGNEAAKTAAKSSLTNAVIGILIVLGAWVLIDTIMKTLVKEESGFGPWNSIPCWNQRQAGVVVYEKDGLIVVAKPSGQTTKVNPNTLVQCATNSSACGVSALVAAGLSSSQANVMSCIAMTESSGEPATPPYNIKNPGSNSTACGTFQIVKTTWDATATGACRDFYSNCQKASCNAQTMVALVKSSGYSPWTCESCNAKASACILKYQ